MQENNDNAGLIGELSRSIAAQLSGDRTITILVVGRVGSGKSSTVNSLLGSEWAKVSMFRRGTDRVNAYDGDIQGIKFRVIDTPGFGDPEPGQDERTLDQIRALSGSCDALLYISPLNQPRVDMVDFHTARTLVESFPEVVWKKSVIVLTKADLVAEDFAHQRDSWAGTLQGLFRRAARELSQAEPEEIPAIAISNGRPTNPDGNQWMGALFVAVLQRIDLSVAIRFLFSQVKRIDYEERAQRLAGDALHASAYGVAPSYTSTPAAPTIVLDAQQRASVREVLRDALAITASATAIGAALGAVVGGPPGALLGGAIGATAGIIAAAAVSFWDDLKSLF